MPSLPYQFISPANLERISYEAQVSNLNETFVLFMWAVTISIHKIEMFTLRVLTFNIFAPRVETPQPTKD